MERLTQIFRPLVSSSFCCVTIQYFLCLFGEKIRQKGKRGPPPTDIASSHRPTLSGSATVEHWRSSRFVAFSEAALSHQQMGSSL